MGTIPRAEVTAVLDRHNDRWPSLHAEVYIQDIRDCAAVLRDSTDPDAIAEANDLDALADRYEQETAS